MDAAFIILLALLQIGDYLTTRYALEVLPDNREANPLLAKLFSLYGLRRVLIIKGIVAIAAALYAPESAMWSCIPFAAIVANNCRVILAGRKKHGRT